MNSFIKVMSIVDGIELCNLVLLGFWASYLLIDIRKIVNDIRFMFIFEFFSKCLKFPKY